MLPAPSAFRILVDETVRELVEGILREPVVAICAEAAAAGAFSALRVGKARGRAPLRDKVLLGSVDLDVRAVRRPRVSSVARSEEEAALDWRTRDPILPARGPECSVSFARAEDAADRDELS